MEHATAFVDHDATTPIEVRFLNLVARSAEVRRRVFGTEEDVLVWLAENTAHVELVSMAPVGRAAICGCQRLVDAGWAVRCAACGRVTAATNPAVASPLLEIQYRLPETPGGHTCTGCVACYDDMAADADADDADEAFEAQRDAELADEAARRVA